MVHFASTNKYVYGVAQEFGEMGFGDEFKQISKMDLLWFYLKHPALLAKKIDLSVAHSGMVRPWYLANYRADVGRFVLSDKFSGWSTIRPHMGFDTVYGNVVLWLAFIAAFMVLVKAYLMGRRKWLFVLAAILGAGLYSLVIQVIANGEGDLAKHMFAYVQFADMAFILLIYGLAITVDEHRLKELADTRNLTLVAAPVLCLLVLMIPVISSAVKSLAPVHVVDLADAQVGDAVYFGNYNGEDLLWFVVDDSGYSQTLVSIRNIGKMAFESSISGNYWVDSEIRWWLNGEFLNSAFADFDDRSKIVESSRNLILSADTREFAEMGDRDFYAFHIPRYAFRGVDRAYRMGVSDMVGLPNAEVMQKLIDMGQRIQGDYWLDVPRFLDDELLRYVSKDGFILFKAAQYTGGVRPVIEVAK